MPQQEALEPATQRAGDTESHRGGPAPRSLAGLVAWIAATTVLGAGLGAATAALVQPVYRADASLIVLETGGDGPPRELNQRVERVLGTWLFVLEDRSTRDQAAATLSGRYPDDELARATIEVRPIDDSTAIVVVARAGDPRLAADLAGAVLTQAQEDELSRTHPLRLLGAITPPRAPESPRPDRNVVLGATAGMLVGIALAFLTADLRRAGRRLPRVLERWL